MSNEIGTILSIIPQSYYDFIAKIIPSFAALEISSYIFCGKLIVPSNAWETIFGIVAIYIIGIVLDIGGLFLFDFIDKLSESSNGVETKSRKSNNTNEQSIAIKYIHESLHQIADSQDANILIKMLAETVLLRSFSLFFMLLFIAKIIEIYYNPNAELISCLKYMVLSVFVAFLFHVLRVTLQKETAIRAKSMLESTQNTHKKRFYKLK